MSQPANPVKIGAFVVAALAVAVLTTVVIGSGSLFRSSHEFVVYFDGSVNGLRDGAPVKFKGVPIGRVTQIRLPVTRDASDLPIPVLIELDGQKLETWRDRSEFETEQILARQIERGLRVQLESESIVTGVLFVALKFDPESPAKLHAPLDGLPEIPTLPTDFEAMQSEAARILKEFKRIDFHALVEEMTRAVRAIADLSGAPEIRGALKSVDETSKDIRDLATTIDALIEPLASDVHSTATSARTALNSVRTLAESLDRNIEPLIASARANADRLQTLQTELGATVTALRKLLDPSAPLVVQLDSALRELSETARATRRLVEELERDPGALLRGKALREEQP